MADEYQYTPVDWGDTPPPSWLPPEARHVLEVLGYLDRPRNALAAAVAGAQTPGLSASNEFWKGLQGKTDVSWGDVVGIPKATEKDDWATYIAKGGSRLLLDMIADPMNLVPLVGPAAKAGQLGRVGLKAAKGVQDTAKYLGGTQLAKAIGHGAWGFPEVTKAMDTAQRVRNVEREAFMKEYAQAAPKLDQLREGEEGLLRYRELLERPDKAFDLEKAGADPDIYVPLKTMHNQTLDQWDEMNNLLSQLGLPQHAGITEPGYGVVSRFRKKPGVFDEAKDHAGSMFQSMDPRSREIFKFVEPSSGEEIISKIDKKGLKKNNLSYDLATDTYYLEHPTQGPLPLEMKQASLADIVDAGIMGRGHEFVTSPAESLALQSSNLANKNAFLTFMKDMEGSHIFKTADLPTGQGSFRQINVPGFDDLWAHPSVANYIENQAARSFDPKTSIGALGDIGRKFIQDTMPGRLLGEATTLFKRATLPLHPAYHLGNEMSNIGLQYQSGLSPIDIIRSNTAALRTQLGHDPEILSGLSGNRLVEELGVRDALGGWYGSELQDNLARAVTPPVLGGALGETATQGIDAVRRMHDWGYKVGSHIEDNARMGAAIDWLRKNAPDFAAKSPAEQELLLDQAARFAKDALIDYGPQGLTPFEQSVMKPIVPFYGWTRGIAGQTLQAAIEHPERLARHGRFLDEFSDPLTEEQKALADPWIREAGPVLGMLGMKIPGAGGMPGMTQLARMIPQGNIEQMLGRPTDYAIGAVNPFLKMPFEMLGNKSYFKDRPIDRIASSPFLDPLLGNDYEKATSTLFGQQLPAAYDYLLSQIPGGRYVSEANLLGRGAGLWADPYKAPETPTSAAVSYLTGQKTYPYDEAKFRRNREREWSLKNTNIRKDMQMAIGKGDFDAASFYREMMMKHQADKGRQLHLEAM